MSHAVAIIGFLLFPKESTVVILPPGSEAEIHVSILVSDMKLIFTLSLESWTF